MRLRLTGLVGLGILGLASTGWAQSVVVDTTSLTQRLERIEQRLNTVERRSGGSSSAEGDGSLAAGYTAADLERRMTVLEEDSSKNTGAMDRMSHAIETLAKRFDDWQKDADMRMSDIEARLGKLEQNPSTAAAPATGSGTPVAAASASKEAASSTPKKPVIPAGLSPADHYNKAYAYLTAADYANAQAWLEEFLKRYPTDKLADNAHYWLGEVYLVQNNPTNAAVEFRDGLKAFPKGSKAPANMFKLGVALEQLKKPDLAKVTWEQLIKVYPNAPESARAKDKLVQLKEKPKK